MDKLSESLLVEHGGLELYRVALSRCANPNVRQSYLEFAQETSRHRTILIRLGLLKLKRWVAIPAT